MAVGRISGPLLKANLLRNGVDLAFENDLLYLDVNNLRIGINTNTPTHDLQVSGTTKTTNLIVDNQVQIGSLTVAGNTISSSLNTISLLPAGGDPVVYQAKLYVDDFDIHGNQISIKTTNKDLEIRPNGTGSLQIHSDTTVYGNIHATGSITADGNLTLGDVDTDNITFNAEITSDIIPDQTDTYNLGSNPALGGKRWANVFTENVTSTTLDVGSVVIGGIDLALAQGNIIYVSTEGDDANSGVHQNDPFLTIKHALSQATTGDLVFIYPGTYIEVFPLTVPKGVSVRGAGIRSVKIIPSVATQYNDAFLLNGETTVEDLTVADFFSGGNNFTVIGASAGSTTINVGTAPFAHTYVSGGTIKIGSTNYNITNAVYTHGSGTVALTHTGGTATLGQTVFVSNLTFSCNGGTRVFPDNGYAFKFATDFEVTNRSPYVKNVTVITRGSTTSPSDPYGFASGDAGKGAYIDGAYATANSAQASMLFHSVTVITPNTNAITATNGARIEWLNSFTYFADKGLYAFSSNDGFAGQGKTVIRLSEITGTFSVGDTVTSYASDGTTVLASGTVSAVDGTKISLTGKQLGFVNKTETTGKVIYAFGNAQLATAQKKFGTASLLLDGTTDYASILSNLDFAFGTGDFCIETFVYPTATGTYRTLFDLRNNAGDTGGIILGLSDTGALYFFYNGNYRVGPVGSIPLNQWTHIALARHSGVTKAFVGGTQVGSNYTDTNNYAQRGVRIGADPNGNYAFTGYFDEVRISKGVSRYTTAFTPTTSQFFKDQHTVLLSHFDGADASTTFVDESFAVQDVRSSSGATAKFIELADYSDFGAEIRSIGSANIYGTYGAYGDGAGVTMYLIGHNFAYIGTGKDTTNDDTLVIQANEVVELNNANVYYNSVDHKGDFRVGDLFYVNQQTGTVTFSTADINVVGSNITLSNGSSTTIIDATLIDTGNLRISGNTISSLTGDINLTAASDIIDLMNNVNIAGNLDVTGNVTIGGNITIGNEATDTINFVAGINSDLIPRVTETYSLGTDTLRWTTLYAGQLLVDDVEINNNQISSLNNTDLSLQANGTGVVVVESLEINANEISSTNNDDIVLTPQGTGRVVINSTQSILLPRGTIAERPSPAVAGMIRYNTETSRYEGYDGTNWVVLAGVSDVDQNTYITAELSPGANDNIIRFYVDGNLVADLDNTRFNVQRIDVDDLKIENNTISSTTTNTNIVIAPNGTGALRIGNLAIKGNEITNTVAGAVTTLNSTGDGYVRIVGSNAVVLPAGDTLSRPLVPVLGMTRFNSELKQIEVFDGTVWASAAGSSGAINVNQANDIGIVSALILG